MSQFFRKEKLIKIKPRIKRGFIGALGRDVLIVAKKMYKVNLKNRPPAISGGSRGQIPNTNLVYKIFY